MMNLSKQIKNLEPVHGVNLYSIKTPLEDAIILRGSILGGAYYSPRGNIAVAGLSSAMLDKGTKRHTKQQLREKLESVGASLEFSSDNMRVNFKAVCRKMDAPMVIEVLAEQLREPAFGKSEFAIEREKWLGALEIEKEDTYAQAKGHFLRTLYSMGHPNYAADIGEMIKCVSRARASELASYHTSVYGLGQFNIVATGDVDPEALSNELRKRFTGWKRSDLTVLPANQNSHEKDVAYSREVASVRIDDKTSVDIMMGAGLGIDATHADYYPLIFGMHVFGAHVFISRLFLSVREKKGLTYRIMGGIDGAVDNAAGYWWVSASFAPELLERGFEAIEDELEKFASKGISAKELDVFRNQIKGSYEVGISTANGLSRAILANAEQGRPMVWIDDFVPTITSIDRHTINKAVSRYVKPAQIIKIAAGTV